MIPRTSVVAGRPAVGECVINSPSPVLTPMLSANIFTWAVDITLNRTFAPNDSGPIEWIYGVEGGGVPLMGFGTATGAHSGETLTFWSVSAAGNFATSMTAGIVAGRHTFVLRAVGRSPSLRSIWMDGTGQSLLHQNPAASPIAVPAARYAIGERPGVSPVAQSLVHRFIADTAGWDSADAQVWDAGGIPNTGGNQYIAPCPLV